MKYFFGVMAVLVMVSCESTTDQIGGKTYYDLRGFVENQTKILKDTKPLVYKKLLVNNKSEVIRLKISDWEKELELFKQLDLNKPAFKTSYEMKESKFTDSTAIEYTLKSSEKAPVKVLKIVLGKNKELKTLWAKVQQANNLYHSDKTLFIIVDKSLIKRYVITGYQQLKYFEKKPFSVDGELIAASQK